MWLFSGVWAIDHRLKITFKWLAFVFLGIVCFFWLQVEDSIQVVDACVLWLSGEWPGSTLVGQNSLLWFTGDFARSVRNILCFVSFWLSWNSMGLCNDQLAICPSIHRNKNTIFLDIRNVTMSSFALWYRHLCRPVCVLCFWLKVTAAVTI